MKIDHFTDAQISAIRSGNLRLTEEERAFLLESTPRFEECDHTPAELAAMSDDKLITIS